MAEALRTLYRKKSGTTPRRTSSPALAPGVTRLDRRSARKASGPAAALVNLSARQAKELGLLTSGTYGQPGSTLSSSADLSFCLASRLHTAALRLGSILYKLTWKELATPQGRSMFRLVASADRMSVKELTGWPMSNTPSGGPTTRRKNGTGLDLDGVALLAAWPTAAARDYKSNSASEEFRKKQWAMTRGKPLSAVVTLSGTPSGVRSSKGMSSTGMTPDGRKHTVSLEHLAKFVASRALRIKTSGVQTEDGCWLGSYPTDGKFNRGSDSDHDLFMSPVKQVKWGNVYEMDHTTIFHNTEEEARKSAEACKSLGAKIIATAVRIEYEED